MIILEYMARGSLKDVLRHSKPTADGVLEILPAEMARMCLDVASGMAFLSSKGFVHRDVAARSANSPVVQMSKLTLGM